MTIDIWVPVRMRTPTADEVADGVTRAFEPDKPRGVRVEGHFGAPFDKTNSNGDLVCSKLLITVDEKDLPAIREHLQAKGTDYQRFDDGAEKDKRMVNMLRHCRGDFSKAEAFFDSIDTKDATRKRTIKDVLIQAAARGMEPTTAEATRKRLALPSSKQTDGIDSEIHAACVAHIARTSPLVRLSGAINDPVATAQATALLKGYLTKRETT